MKHMRQYNKILVVSLMSLVAIPLNVSALTDELVIETSSSDNLNINPSHHSVAQDHNGDFLYLDGAAKDLYQDGSLLNSSDAIVFDAGSNTLLSCSLAVDPATTTVCVAWAEAKFTSGDPEYVKFYYYTWDYTTSWSTPSKSTLTVVRDYDGDTTNDIVSSNAFLWFDESNCYTGYAACNPTDTHDHYYTLSGHSGSYDYERAEALVKAVCADGTFWIACELGYMIDHSSANPSSFNFEEHHGLYLFKDGASQKYDGELFHEECEPSNSQAPNPQPRATFMVGDPDGRDTMILTQKDIFNLGAGDIEYAYDPAGDYPGGTVQQGVPMEIEDDDLYCVYKDTSTSPHKIKYDHIDLGAATPTWATSTVHTQATGFAPVSTGIDSAGGIHIIITQGELGDIRYYPHTDANINNWRYANSSGNDEVATGNFFYGDKLLVTGTGTSASYIIQLEYGIEYRGDIDEWRHTIASF